MSFLDETLGKINNMKEKYDEAMADLPDFSEATITNVRDTNDDGETLCKGDIFGENVKFGKPEDPILEISFDIYNNGVVIDEESQIFSVDHSKRGFLRRFVDTYGDPRQENLKVMVKYDWEKKRWNIVLD